MKQIWKELPKHMDTPVAPLDEEMLVDLAKEPAVIEGADGKRTFGMVGIFRSKPCYILVFLVPNTNEMDLLGMFFSLVFLCSYRKGVILMAACFNVLSCVCLRSARRLFFEVC